MPISLGEMSIENNLLISYHFAYTDKKEVCYGKKDVSRKRPRRGLVYA